MCVTASAATAGPPEGPGHGPRSRVRAALPRLAAAGPGQRRKLCHRTRAAVPRCIRSRAGLWGRLGRGEASSLIARPGTGQSRRLTPSLAGSSACSSAARRLTAGQTQLESQAQIVTRTRDHHAISLLRPGPPGCQCDGAVAAAPPGASRKPSDGHCEAGPGHGESPGNRDRRRAGPMPPPAPPGRAHRCHDASLSAVMAAPLRPAAERAAIRPQSESRSRSAVAGWRRGAARVAATWAVKKITVIMKLCIKWYFSYSLHVFCLYASDMPNQLLRLQGTLK